MSTRFLANGTGLKALETALERCPVSRRGGLLLAFLQEQCQSRDSLDDRSASYLRAQGHAFSPPFRTRVRPWWDRLLLNPRVDHCLWQAHRVGYLGALVPELLDGEGLEQSFAHPHDVLGHNIRTCALVPPRLHLRLAALLHDVGKPGYSVEDMLVGRRFPGHHLRSALCVPPIMERLGYPRPLICRVEVLVSHHMFIWTPDQGAEPVLNLVRSLGRGAAADLIVLVQADRTAIWGHQAQEINMELEKTLNRVLASCILRGFEVT